MKIMSGLIGLTFSTPVLYNGRYLINYCKGLGMNTIDAEVIEAAHYLLARARIRATRNCSPFYALSARALEFALVQLESPQNLVAGESLWHIRDLERQREACQ